MQISFRFLLLSGALLMPGCVSCGGAEDFSNSCGADAGCSESA